VSGTQKKRVEIYTDGACSGNPGPGGWAAVLLYGARRKEISGGEADTTNNRMEILAAIRALEALNQPCRVTLYSDSAYLVNAMQKGWATGWRANAWRRGAKGGGAVKNPDLWAALLGLCERHEVEFVRVQGHADNELNNRCDQLATGEIKKHAESA